MSLKADFDAQGKSPTGESFDVLVPDSQVRRELGGISAMSVWRWDHKPETAPPGWGAPVRLGKRNYRRRSVVEAVKAKGEVRR